MDEKEGKIAREGGKKRRIGEGGHLDEDEVGPWDRHERPE